MGVELTREQLEAARRNPIRVTDPETAQEYVLITAELFERVLGYDDSDFDPREAYPLMDKVLAADDADDPAPQSSLEERKPA